MEREKPTLVLSSQNGFADMAARSTSFEMQTEISDKKGGSEHM
jgi:hypothetical protein